VQIHWLLGRPLFKIGDRLEALSFSANKMSRSARPPRQRHEKAQEAAEHDCGDTKQHEDAGVQAVADGRINTSKAHGTGHRDCFRIS
jgi:hypothetical protein